MTILVKYGAVLISSTNYYIEKDERLLDSDLY